MTQEHPASLPPFTEAQRTLIAQLTPQQVEAIDLSILAMASAHWRKVAMVVAGAMGEASYISGVPDAFYGHRVRLLVESGQLEAQGNVEYMRFSEVRLPQAKNGLVQGVA